MYFKEMHLEVGKSIWPLHVACQIPPEAFMRPNRNARQTCRDALASHHLLCLGHQNV